VAADLQLKQSDIWAAGMELAPKFRLLKDFAASISQLANSVVNRLLIGLETEFPLLATET
jgi:hypothetical protein